jgi:hypothetical protein
MRWLVTITYRTDDGPLTVDYDIEELDMLQELVERGPNWNTIENIVITLARVSDAGLTLEESIRR